MIDRFRLGQSAHRDVAKGEWIEIEIHWSRENPYSPGAVISLADGESIQALGGPPDLSVGLDVPFSFWSRPPWWRRIMRWTQRW